MEPKSVPTEMQPEEAVETEIVHTGRRRAYAGRLGCAGLVLAWALCLLIPGVLMYLAVQGEIAIWHGSSVPEWEQHPLLQVKLLMEIETRGISITTSTSITLPADVTCMQTDVRFVLWQGSGDNVNYCDCYQGDESGKVWQLISTIRGVCSE
ncbi:MAG: hypothetical protein H7X77_09870 [Anaerolineae bacterium]|nr:hypothetical protein [Anaerolineae bacterium]